MRKLIIFFITSLLLLSIPISSMAKWSVEQSVNFHGHMGALEMTLETLDIDLSDEVLYPGWSKDISFTVSNTGNIPFDLEGTLLNLPSFLVVTADIPSFLASGATASIILHCSIDSELTDSMSEDAGFSIKLEAKQHP